VICAFGRLGTWFGTERWGVAPDITVFAKGVTSGYLPLGGVTVSGAIAEPFWSADYGTAFRHGSTYAGHPACCAAALANLDIIEEEQLLASSQALEAPLHDRLAALAEHPLVAESRAIGLMGALEVTAEAVAADPAVTMRLHRAARQAGVLVRPLLSAIAVSPPLIVTEGELELMADGIATALDAVALELAA
jgi:putrescine aminotransferase